MKGIDAGHQPAALLQFGEFPPRATADRELKQRLARKNLQTAAHGAGMAVASSQPAVPEIGMGIELHQHQVGVALCHGLHGTGADRMLSAQHEGPKTQGEHGFGRLLHLG